MNKILCPVDFSDTSLNAIEFAVEIGKKFHSKVTLLHVFTEEDFNKVLGNKAKGKSFKELLGMAKNRISQLADAINEDAVKDGLDKCDFYLEMGELTEKINETAVGENYDLIVMGTTGVSKRSGIFFGSNTEDVIDEVRRPVMCIPSNASFTKFKKIVYGSDYLEEDKVAIQEVISFATMFDARINVVHVNSENEDEEYKKFTQELKSFIQYNKITFTNRQYDDIGKGLLEYMNSENADLLVAFKRKRNIVESIFSKSITKILSHTSDKPLLILKL
ncbi:universal stress protein [Fulvivirga lutea]|uniref:Universal stress protein n=1 Tax=Fulvivirga lutea TaxID=2810512 RepID=A0A974WG56_9BACT|nr:universal stress protein [Fulvivirga lutea]QSE96532.1 universal stress protein [Fulvivirga lutea]